MVQNNRSDGRRPSRHPDFGDDKPWLCNNCSFMLGLLSPDGETIRIKYKDLYLEIEGGNIKIKCRKCGRDNQLAYELDKPIISNQTVHYSVKG